MVDIPVTKYDLNDLKNHLPKQTESFKNKQHDHVIQMVRELKTHSYDKAPKDIIQLGNKEI